ncbi:MAG: hypothetical protein JXR88_17490 [Clostridia bacterium]|nr:hypothetical protein [Clostridia bacterium]
MEKVKDFLYDISDLFFSLLIIGIIFFVVSWKLTDTMSVTWFSNIDRDAVNELEFNPITTPDDSSIVEPDDPVVETEDPITEEPIVEEVENPIVEVKEVSFTIEKGNTGYQVAVKLQDEGLIENVDDFLSKLGEMDLGNKLQADTFKLNTGMTTEEIILKLARQD